MTDIDPRWLSCAHLFQWFYASITAMKGFPSQRNGTCRKCGMRVVEVYE